MQPQWHEWKLQGQMVLATVLIFLGFLWLNDVLFARWEYTRGIDWVYLPAGARVLCTLLFAEAGGIGLLLASWLACFYYFFPGDPARAWVGCILASLAPYGVYKLFSHLYRFQASLANLTPRRLLWLAVVYSIASPVLHHLWFALQGGDQLLPSLVVMCIGDLSGTLIVLYSSKLLLHGLTRWHQRQQP